MKFRLILIGLVVALAVASLRSPQQTSASAPSLSLNPNTPNQTAVAGGTVQFSFVLQNLGPTADSFTIAVNNLPIGWGWSMNVGNPIPLNNGSSIGFIVTITVPAGTATGTVANFTVSATSSTAPISTATVSGLTVTVVAPTATPTVTPTPTNTPTNTPTVGSATPTPTNTCTGSGGTRNDGFEPDDSKAQARRIEIDIPQKHALCPVGDEDWLIFGGLEGKVYTIDVPDAVDGIDPSLTLYDENGNQLAFNDDYYLRNNDPTDVRPRIQSWRAPANGQYYIKVREAAGRGFFNAFYTIVLQSESYGPTPTLIPEICQDLYEPDGLPELAHIMVVGEVHKIHRICPTGDADWVKFFGKAGKSYTIFTTNATPGIGLDTVLVLTDRDGTSILTFNDDYGASLDSRIDFAPEVDGFYYAQVKNVGDIGNQFATYSLTFQVQGNANTGPQPTEPGGQPTVGVPTSPPGITPTSGTGTGATPTSGTGTGATPTVTSGTPGTSVATATPKYPTPTAGRAGNKVPNIVTYNAGSFADPAFARVWERADAPIAGGAATRTWLWGPKSGSARGEVYDESAGGLRQVQYFDKSRMEITNFRGDRNSQWFVTNGLLAKELIVGQIQLGDNSYVKRSPAAINIAGDLDSSIGPTYASFANVLGAAADRTGQYADQTLSRSGKVAPYGGAQRPAALLVQFVPQTNHNIASAFWDFMNRSGAISENGRIREGKIMDWVFALGYPLSEPYWTRVKVGGVEQDVLVQAFERRVLTYTPANPPEWQVEMGNVGQHYERWRYQ